MRLIAIADVDAWRARAGALIAAGVAPDAVRFGPDDGQATLLTDAGERDELAPVPSALATLIARVGCHRDDGRWDALYRLWWRLAQGEPRLLSDVADPDVRRVQLMDKAIGRDLHKMHAFVRFRELIDPNAPTNPAHFIAFYQPDHRILALAAPFFVRRFGAMHWSILTPDGSVTWDHDCLRVGPAASRADAPAHDAHEALWRTDYSHIFNPARVKVRAMVREMPVRFWQGLPEAEDIPELLARAPERAAAMASATSAPIALPPDGADVPTMLAAAERCRACARCDLPFALSAGHADPQIVLISDRDDDRVVLRQFLRDANIPGVRVHLTFAVRHGTDAADLRTLSACRPWLLAELAALRPGVVVCLGAAAALAWLGRRVLIKDERGRVRTDHRLATVHGGTLVTHHPRRLDPERYQQACADLRLAGTLAGTLTRPAGAR